MHTIEQLNDGRAVYLNGHRVNVADVPIFRKTLALNNQYYDPVSYTHLTLPTTRLVCRSRWSPYH